MATVELVDVSFRDGNQSLWGAVGIRTPHVLQIAPLMDRVGFRALDFTSSTHMGVSVRTHREDPWDRIRRTHAAMPHTPLQFIGTGFRFISWEQQHPDVMQLIYDRLVVAGMQRFVVLDPMHDLDAVRATARQITRAGGAEVVAALTYTISERHDDELYAGLATDMAACPDIDRVYVKDPAGLLTPDRARTLLPRLVAALDGVPLELHSHASLGLSPLTYLDAPGYGVATLQVGTGPLSDGTSLPDAQRTVANLRAHGHDVAVDDRLLDTVADYLHRLARAEGRPAGGPRTYDASFVEHQVAGGVMTTLHRQLAELGLEHRFDEVMEEVKVVRAELGHPIMVTPFPQMVCTQALYNIIGDERYDNVPDQVIRYVQGSFGRPTFPVDAEVEARILDRRRAAELRDEPDPPTPEELRRRFPGVGDEELLLRATMPEEQVDAMYAAPPAAGTYRPELAPVRRLLHELRDRGPIEHLAVAVSGAELRVSRTTDEAAADEGAGDRG